jgi:putative transposase
MTQFKISLARACRLMGLSRSVYQYQHTQNSDFEIKEIVKNIAYTHKRYGFRKVFHTMRQRGFKWNHKRIYRIYRLLGLNLKKKPKKRLPTREKVTLYQPAMSNEIWSLDYMSDALVSGKKFRTANVIDDYNREVIVLNASVSLPSCRVVKLLDNVAQIRGYPSKIRMDNGPENISKTMKGWAEKHKIELVYIEPGEPAQNGYIERFNRTYREEVLDMYLFQSIEHVQKITDDWMNEYNNQRPHHSLGNLTPREYKIKHQNSIFALY